MFKMHIDNYPVKAEKELKRIDKYCKSLLQTNLDYTIKQLMDDHMTGLNINGGIV